MTHWNVEIKARCADADNVRRALREGKADFRGKDRQIDTYFRVPLGRLKLREGNIENYLIAYEREETAGLKESRVSLYPVRDPSPLKEVLMASLGMLAIVEKLREIYFIGNVKFHVDQVAGLGEFVEIEALDREGVFGKPALSRQCRFYMELLGIRDTDLVPASYADLLQRKAAAS